MNIFFFVNALLLSRHAVLHPLVVSAKRVSTASLQRAKNMSCDTRMKHIARRALRCEPTSTGRVRVNTVYRRRREENNDIFPTLRVCALDLHKSWRIEACADAVGATRSPYAVSRVNTWTRLCNNLLRAYISAREVLLYVRALFSSRQRRGRGVVCLRAREAGEKNGHELFRGHVCTACTRVDCFDETK